MWQIIGYSRNALKNFISCGRTNLINFDTKETKIDQDTLVSSDILELWRCLALLARNYEDVCREWYLPTASGYECTYQEL